MASGAIVFDRALEISPDGAWFDRAHWSALGKADAHAGGRGGVAFVDTPAGRVRAAPLSSRRADARV